MLVLFILLTGVNIFNPNFYNTAELHQMELDILLQSHLAVSAMLQTIFLFSTGPRSCYNNVSLTFQDKQLSHILKEQHRYKRKNYIRIKHVSFVRWKEAFAMLSKPSSHQFLQTRLPKNNLNLSIAKKKKKIYIEEMIATFCICYPRPPSSICNA